ncbi:MAG: ATP-binding protein [Pseudomonadota bacterium]
MNDQATDNFIPVQVDKSHIITIGERLYTESIEFIRELVNNAYDADASLVEVVLGTDTVEVRDNGTGMDREGLIQFFNIGSQEKLDLTKSRRFGREMIGQFGIGKFASLAACGRFEVITRKKGFAARVVFDKAKWESAGKEWNIPLERLSLSDGETDGTTVVLRDLSRKFGPKEIEAKLVDGTPLKAPDFTVKLNGRRITPRSYGGHKIPVLLGTDFGPVTGEIVILPESAASSGETGIEIRVKQVTIRRELFGMETWGKAMAMVRGEIYADFLPVTSDRTGFIRDTPAWEQFMRVMQQVMDDVRRALQKMTRGRESRKAGRALKEALSKISRALEINPDLSPFGTLLVGDPADKGGEKGCEGQEAGPDDSKDTVVPAPKPKPLKKRKRKPKARLLSPHAVMKRMKVGRLGISCCIDSFGEDGPEAFTEDTTVFINKDHPLYRKEVRKKDTHVLNLARLIAQEIAIMRDSRSPRQAFDLQSKLLKAAFSED